MSDIPKEADLLEIKDHRIENFLDDMKSRLDDLIVSLTMLKGEIGDKNFKLFIQKVNAQRKTPISTEESEILENLSSALDEYFERHPEKRNTTVK